MALPPLPDGFRPGISLLAYLLLLLWVLWVIDCLLGRRLSAPLSIHPRSWMGLPGIVVAPLFHQDLKHLAANSAPFVILGSLILFQGLSILALVTGFCWLFSGFLSWLLGRPGSRHLGISGVIFGYLGFILLRGYFTQSLPAIALAGLVAILYGGCLWGLLPLQRGKSWVGHSSGFLAGAIAARHLESMQTWWMGNMNWPG
ncbi:MAG: rhomboid family intramembrane serine protease [Nodosilinea sp.]